MNINRDYLIINDVKKSNVKLDNGSMFFYITDKNTQNIFVNLVINISNNDLIQKYANIENAEDYTLTMNIVKPSNTYKVVEGKLHDKEKAIFEFNLNKDCCDEIGTYRCELLTKCNIDGHEEVTTSNKLTYKVKSSVLNDLDDIVEAPEYPLVIQLFDKLSDIEQYEEDRRANELARQLAEEQRQARFNTLDADMTDRVTAMDDKMADVENRVSTKEQVVDKLVADTKADIDSYKEAKDQEIDEYKTAKDAEINEAITNQDNKIDTAINAQNDRIAVVENNDAVQDNRLDTLENRDTIHEARMVAIEAKNTEQDNRLDTIEAIDVAQNSRLDAIEAKNQQQDDRLLDIEKANKRQDMNLKCLFAESKNNMIDIAEEGNSIYFQNSTIGYTLIDEIKGNTLVNCNKEPDKELILNGNINTSGDNTVTITEGVDGGLVDVALEGNTLVNVSKTKDSTAITEAYTVENSGNHIALQGDVDGSCRPVVYGNTLWIDNDTEEILTAFDETRNLRLQSTFEDNLVTQEMVDSGEEVADNLGEYRVDYKVTGKNLFDGETRNGYYSNGVFKSNSSNLANVNPIRIKPNTSYVGSGDAIPRMSFYDKDMNFILSATNQCNISPSDACYMNIHAHGATWFQIEEGDTATEYEPYKEYAKTLYLNSPLLEGDTIEEKDDGIYHVHRSELVAYTEGDEASLITDKVHTLHQLETPTYELIEQSNLVIPSYTNGHLDLTSAVPVEKVDFLPFSEELTYLYANTQYTLQFVSDKAISADITLGGTSLLAQSIVAGLNRISITTPETLVDNKLIIDGVGANISEVVVTDTDREFMYFEGMKSVGECEGNIEISSNNKNLNKFPTVLGYIYSDTGLDKQASNRFRIDGYVENLIEGDTYRISCTKDNGQTCVPYHSLIIFLDKDKQVISSILNSVITIPHGCKYIRVASESSTSDINSTFYQITRDVDDFTQYTPNKSNTQQLTHEPLRAVGDAKDRYVLIDGKWHIERKCGYKNSFSILEEFANDSLTSRGIKLVKINKDIEKIESSYVFRKAKSNKFKCVPYNYINSKFNELFMAYISPDGHLWVSVGTNYTRQDILNYTSDCQIIYELQSPTYEPIDYNPLEVYSGTTNITTNSTIPTNITVKNHGFNCLLKPSTTYTVSSNLGLNTVTTPAELTEDCLRFYDTDTSDVTTMRDVLVLEGDWTTKANLIPANFSGIESAFEQEYDAEKGKYKVNVKVANEDKTKENNITFYINEPLRGVENSKDKVFIKDDKVVVQRNCGVRPYEDGDFGTYPTDKVNTVYQLAEPTYEEVEYNDTKLFIESFKNSTLFYNSNVPVTSKLYYSYSVPIVDTVAQTASISDQQDSMIIDLATQVAVMEMMLM